MLNREIDRLNQTNTTANIEIKTLKNEVSTLKTALETIEQKQIKTKDEVTHANL